MAEALRRDLRFNELSEAVYECRRLLETGYTRNGNWSLGQICRHLRLTIEANMSGYPKWMTILGFPLRPILRKFVLPRLLNFDSPAGFRTAGIFVPPEDTEDENEVNAFADCVAAFQATKQPLHPHPGFGRMSHAEFVRFHAAHSAHHLGFLADPPNDK